MKFKKTDLNEVLKTLAREYTVFAPIVENEEKKFMPWAESKDVEMEGLNTIKPPKDVLFPNVEKMYRYKMGLEGFIEEIFPEDTKRILFGIRPCDMRSIDSMDKVFLTKEYVDSYYAKRRDDATIVAFGCTEAGRTCFCESMGLNPNDAPSADVMMNVSADGEDYVLEARTEKGEELVKKLEGLITDGGEAKKDTKCSLVINKAEDLDKKLAKMFEHPIWDKVTKGCIGCGTCTFVCPTCYCFDIDSENYGAEGCKYRCWDSCMFSDYTRLAGGANPRPTKKERLRNRYMHKLSYFNERYGETLCVGCGRCVEKCPAHLDISEFIEKASAAELGKEDK
ncbi:MAG: 4Fe-4S dicluster domain-containing protein [Lachnospiraceae bacterium]|nr:4Fe-4S dicluster domain-containing protein [Lachnospiraceae bacterium]